ncbi:MAG: mechanosensitive ion channel [Acidobacteriaceae bacterium]|nr:mechanosensitive ion channel [Acidobacteriaceae bacterium]
MLGLLVYILVLVPVITASLNTLGLSYVAGPLSAMLNNFLLAIPNLFAAAILIAVSLVVGRMVRQIISGLLTAVGFNRLPAHLGLGGLAATTGSSPADALGNLAFTAIMLFAAMEAARLLQFVLIANLMDRLLIFAFGLYLAHLAARAIRATSAPQARSLALVAQSSILFLVTAMALAEMGLARDIVNLAFGLLLGSLAVAGALAFGLGGRQTASRILERWEQSRTGRPMLAVDARSGSPEITT